ncbi:MAG: hypothetical protein ACRD2G_07420, partial [Terriglobia bacterium]
GVGSIPTDCGVSISKTEFAPRIGLAWRITPTFVARGGYGITNEPYNLADDLRTNYPVLIPLYLSASSYHATGVLDSASLRNAPPGSALPIGIPLPVLPSLSSGEVPIDPNVALGTTGSSVQRGYIQSWNVTLEKELRSGWVAQAGYVATRTIRQLGFLNLNAESPIAPAGCVPGSATAECGSDASRPFYNAAYGFRKAETSLVTPIANNLYDGLQTRLTHRFATGYQLELTYTWSKALGMGGVSNEKSHAYIEAPSFTYLNRGLAPTDRPQNFEALFIAQAPFGANRRWANTGVASKVLGGWQLSGIFTAVSGSVFQLPAGGPSSSNLNATSGNTQRPDLVNPSIAIS